MNKVTIGFWKRSQEFRNVAGNEAFLPVLDSLCKVKRQNDLPASFCLKEISHFSDEDVKFVLTSLYPERSYVCTHNKDGIFCIRQ